MKRIQILGTGCPKCKQLGANAEQAAKDAGIPYEFEKVTDLLEIAKMGVMSTPGLVIDGEIKSVGKLLTPEQISEYLKD
jgi:small redox-active disulfide protein 2